MYVEMFLKTFRYFNVLFPAKLKNTPFSQHDPTSAAADICTE